MRLIGYAVRKRRFFNRGTYLPLADLTVLLGANDAGKTTVLRSLAEDLSGHPTDEAAGGGGALYFRVDDRELPLLSDARTRPFTRRTPFDSWSGGGYDAQRTIEPRADEGTLDAHLRILRETAISEGFEIVLDALAESRVVCVERRDPGLHAQGWAAYWCLPPLADLDPDVRAVLEQSELHRFKRARAEEAGEAYRQPGFLGRAAPRWLEVPDAPVAIAPLGGFPFSMPRALTVPASSAQIKATVLDALIDTVNVTRWGIQDAWRNHELDPEDMPPREGVKVLLEDAGEGSVRAARAAVGAVNLLTAAATAHLPDFVSDRYRLAIGLREIDQWFDGTPLDLNLHPVDDDRPVARFELDDVADGLKLWLQFALLAGVDLLDRLVTGLTMLADDEARRDQEELQHHEEGDEPIAGGSEFNDTVEALEALGPGAAPSLPGPLGEEERHEVRTHVRLGIEVPGRVLLADEPEQHLNPRLQRRAARWLAELAEGGESPCVAASHSNAFLSLPPGAQMVHVRRGPQGIELAPFDAQEATELDEIAASLGFDRGELLAGVSCLLLVEGEHDIAALEGIFGRELAEAKVTLVALRGSPPKGLLEVDALWRFTTAAIAVCLDNVRPGLVERAQEGDDQALRELRTSTAEEEKALARLVTQSRRFAREIHLLGHPSKDLIDALEPDAIRDAYPKYPKTHELADAAFREAVAQAESDEKAALGRKAFYQERYGIDNSRYAYERIAESHRKLGLRPSSLQTIVDRAAEAAMAADTAALGLTLPAASEAPPRPSPTTSEPGQGAGHIPF